MCLAVYVASTSRVPEITNEEISVGPLSGRAAPVAQWFSLPEIRYVGAPGCGCRFPHVVADQPVEWFDEFFDEWEDREPELASVRALFGLLEQLLALSTEVQVYPVWDGDEGKSPKGTIALPFESLDPEKFFFNEQFFYRITSQRHLAKAELPRGA